MSDKPQASQNRGLLKLLLTVMVVLVGLSLYLGRDDGSEHPLLPDLPDAEIVQMRPIVAPHEGYAGSDSCRDCHEHNHKTWFASWHRTMTQEADLDKIVGNFDNVSVTNQGGVHVDLFKRDGRAWFRKNYNEIMFLGPRRPRKEFPIVMMTGSHNMQIYWYPTGRARTLGMMPVVYLREEERWIPRTSAFLQPPDEGHYSGEIGRWNHTCLKCHSTNPDPRYDADGERRSYETQVSEFGITCEACHGPGSAHVQIHSAPDKSSVADLVDRIVDPANLSHERSSQVCGNCHSVNHVLDKSIEWRDFKPGDDLDATRIVEDGSPPDGSEDYVGEEGEEGEQKDATFWSDGMVRVSGREYNGLRISACHTAGTMSCVSCHSMHQAKDDLRPPKEWANDQLQPDKQGDQGCIQCHDAKKFADQSHTHHLPGSNGSSCYNCHMPHTTYGLLKAIRSHTIKSPNVRETLAANRPTACNLCHLDKTLAWTSKHLHDWYGHDQPELTAEHREVATVALLALKGDAGLRALMAWHMSWAPAVAASDAEQWVQPYLSLLLQDPYDAVRYIAGRSLKTFSSHADLKFDYVASPESITKASERAHTKWENSRSREARAAVLLGDDGLLSGRFRAIYADRNDRDMALLE
ncbi:MAG: hypothetical protein ACJASX_000085 [Limisphaerales bacterium]|jgi:hypothetical protein